MHIFPTDALHNERKNFKYYCIPKTKAFNLKEKNLIKNRESIKNGIRKYHHHI